MSDLVPFEHGSQQLDALLIQQIQGNNLALQGNNLALQTLRTQQKQIQELALRKADVSRVRAVEAEVADMQIALHRANFNHDYLTVVALESILKTELSSAERRKWGAELSALSRELCIARWDRPDDRFGTIGSYHPYVCRVYCERKNYPLPLMLEQAADPR